ncbi:hypothetical protein [Sorangium sp. So ce1078]|uniref:hypothetical protein n=1 Tax=Sorangium sp. So ce1078 TaxID=3133329 RepID=UPI003F643A7F
MQSDDAIYASAMSAAADVHRRSARDAVAPREVPPGTPAEESAPPLDQRRSANLTSDIPALVIAVLVALPICLGVTLASGAPLDSLLAPPVTLPLETELVSMCLEGPRRVSSFGYHYPDGAPRRLSLSRRSICRVGTLAPRMFTARAKFA